ncbi:MAG: SusE domain-containing protein [Bacteroidota bacterium]
MKYIFSIALMALLFAACSDDDVRPTTSLNSAPVLTAPGTGQSYAFEEAQADNIFEVFSWTKADFGYQAAIDYKLEMGRTGNDFTPAISLGNTGSTSIEDITVGRINNLMVAAFGINDTINPSSLEFRVCATISDEISALCSDAITLNIVPFPVVIVYDSISVPGDYQGWAPESRDNVIFSRKNDDVYSGYIYFNIDGAIYKFARGWSWDENWGDTQPGDGVLEPGGLGNDIPIGDAGMYLLECDLNTLLHSSTKTDWGVLGSATPTGDASDTDLLWDADRGVLTVTLDLSPGEIRFRANDDDTINFGDTFTNGLLNPDGDGIPITESGNYTIDLILTVGDYTYELKKN